MHYGFVNDETPSQAFTRVMRGQLERAIEGLEAAALRDDSFDARVHSVRKRMKKVRGLLRLASAGLDRDWMLNQDKRFRDAGRRLAGSRRGAATTAAFESLVRDTPSLPDYALAPAREPLNAERVAAEGELIDSAGAIGEVIAALREVLAELDGLELERDGWDAFGRGLRSVYRRARKALGRAEDNPTTERLHDWRRWAKYHYYHVRLLEPSWPLVLGGYRHALEELTEMLGAEHDLDDVRATLIEAPPSPVLVDALPPVLAAVEARRSELQRRAFALGARIFAERPKQVERRFRTYYDRWKTEALPASHVQRTGF